MGFNKDFIWGAATAAFQIEGAASEDGKGPSIWDIYCKYSGKVWNDESPDTACDHYRRYLEDIALMRQIGIKAYRFSISWPRVLPDGVGRINRKGLDFYDRMVDGLLEANITPFATLFHSDYPYELLCRGGWLNPDSSEWFAEYANVVVERFSDRISNWFTINEPQSISRDYYDGSSAPGLKYNFPEVLRLCHNMLLAHGKGVQAIRAGSKTPCRIGFAPVGLISVPATSKSEDITAARQNMFSVTEQNCWNNSWWLDPVFLGHYPEDGLKLFGSAMPKINDNDMKIIAQSLDFCGTNIYGGERVFAGKDGRPEKTKYFTAGDYLTAFKWPLLPEALYWGPRFFWERYHLPVIVTENGMSNTDWTSLDGKVHDPQRIDFLQRYLLELERAANDGVNVQGYFHWTVMDNFEWSEAYKERFGLIYVDFPTQKRILKDSAYWYKSVITSNGASLHRVLEGTNETV